MAAGSALPETGAGIDALDVVASDWRALATASLSVRPRQPYPLPNGSARLRGDDNFTAPGRLRLPFAHPLLAISTLSLTSSFPRRGRLPYKIPEMMS